MAIASNNDFPSLLLSENAVKPAAPAADHWRIYMKDDNKLYREDSGGTETEIGTGSGDMTWAAVLASQLCNEIKGWPPIVNTGDLAALNLWWDSVSTPSTAPSVVAISGEAGITETFELAMKVVTDAGSEGLSQRFTYADEPRVKAGRALSTLWAIWCVGGVGATLSIINSSSEETAAAKVTAAAWTIVEVPNHTLAGTYCDIKIITDGAGTIYAVPLGANIGARGLPLKPRGLRYVDVSTASIVNGVDPGGAAYADLDLTAQTSNLCAAVLLHVDYKDTNSDNHAISARRNGVTADTLAEEVCRNQVLDAYIVGIKRVCTDDGQVIEWKSGAIAGDTETLYIGIDGWWEWE